MTGEPERPAGVAAGQSEERAQEARFGYLLAALLALLVLYPFHDDTPIAHLFFSALNSAILVSGAFAASRSRHTLVIAPGLAAPVLVFEWLYTATRNRFLGDLLYFGVAVFYAFIIYKVLGNALRPGPVTLDKIAGAVAA
jgi:hypothetical protein